MIYITVYMQHLHNVECEGHAMVFRVWRCSSIQDLGVHVVVQQDFVWPEDFLLGGPKYR
jgi:hypothetical protein